MIQFYTYLHCKPNGEPFYIGKGSGRRAYNFIDRQNKYHKRIVKKYGKENIAIFIFPCESERQALDDEIQQIAQFRKEGILLCNMTDGGDGVSGLKMSISAKEKMSNARIGHKVSQETKEKISIGHIGKRKSQSHCENIRRAKLGIKFSDEHKEKLRQAQTGSKKTEETKRRMSIASAGKPKSETHRENIKKSWVIRRAKKCV